MTSPWKSITIKSLALKVGRVLAAHGVDAVLVGGACVSIYSQNRYVSKDLDLVTTSPMTLVKSALAQLGFEPRSSRHFERADCPFYIEFVAPPVAIGDQPIQAFRELRSPLGRIQLLTPTDCVKDRLAAFYYWDDYQALNQALMVSKAHPIDWRDVRAWSGTEKQLEKYARFRKELRRLKK